MPPKIKKYNESKWKEYSNSQVKLFIGDKEKPMIQWGAECDDGLKISSNFKICAEALRKTFKLKFILLDEDNDNDFIAKKLATCKQQPERIRVMIDYLSSLTRHTELREKKIYMRWLPADQINQNFEGRVFTDDIFEVIPILLKQQNGSISTFFKNQLYRGQKEWKADEEHFYNTIKLSDFNALLEQFDIDKSLITIIPDMNCRISQLEMIEDGVAPIRTFSPDGKDVMNYPQAAFYIFAAVVCGNNWNSDYCKLHKNCSKNLKEKICASIKRYRTVLPGTYVSTAHLLESIQKLKDECTFKYDTVTHAPDYLLIGRSPNSDIYLEHYHHTCKFYGLPVYKNFLPEKDQKENVIPIWMARLFFATGWIEQFFDETDEDRFMIGDTMIGRVPMEMRETTNNQFLRPILIKSYDEIQKKKEKEGDTVVEESQTIQKAKNATKPKGTSNNEKSEAEIEGKKSNKPNKTPVTQESNSKSQPKIEEKMKDLKLKKESKTVQNEKELNEAKRNVELEKMLKEKGAEIAQLKKINSQQADEIKGLKLKLKQK